MFAQEGVASGSFLAQPEQGRTVACFSKKLVSVPLGSLLEGSARYERSNPAKQ